MRQTKCDHCGKTEINKNTCDWQRFAHNATLEDENGGYIGSVDIFVDFCPDCKLHPEPVRKKLVEETEKAYRKKGWFRKA